MAHWASTKLLSGFSRPQRRRRHPLSRPLNFLYEADRTPRIFGKVVAALSATCIFFANSPRYLQGRPLTSLGAGYFFQAIPTLVTPKMFAANKSNIKGQGIYIKSRALTRDKLVQQTQAVRQLRAKALHDLLGHFRVLLVEKIEPFPTHRQRDQGFDSHHIGSAGRGI